MAWIFWLSAQPKLPHPGRKVGLSDQLFDYAAHAVTFGVLAALVWRVVIFCHRPQPEPTLNSPPFLSILFSALYALSDEIHQAFVPGRWAKLSDWLADILGILVMVALLNWAKRRLTRAPAS